MIANRPGEGTPLGSNIIRIRGEDTGGALGVLEATLRPGSLISPHTHANDVWVYVLTGHVSVLVGDEIAHGGPGTFLLKPRDVVHAMWNETPRPSRYFEFLTPGGAERFFEEMHALDRDDEEGRRRVIADNGLVFLDDHPRTAELRARVDGVRADAPNMSLRPVEGADHATLRSLFQLYLFDIARYAHGGWNQIGPDGRYRYDWLDLYDTEPERHAFLIDVNDSLGGFVLVNDHVVVDDWAPASTIAEFFVLPEHRGLGVGGAAARGAFDSFPGKWQVAQDSPNVPAQAFWRSVISDYTRGDFEVRHLDDERWKGPVLLFTSGA